MGNYRFKLSDMMPNAWFYKLKEIGKTRNHNTIATTTVPPPHSGKKKQATTSNPSKPKQQTHHRHHQHDGHHFSSYPRKSYHFTRQLIPNDQRFHLSPTSSKSIHSHFPDPPRKSSKTRLLKRRPALRCSSPKLVTSSVSADCSCRPTAGAATLWTKSSDSPPDYSASSSDSFGDESSDLYEDDSFPPEFRSDQILSTESSDKTVEVPGTCGYKVVPDSIENDIIIDVDKKSLATKFDRLDISDLDLPPIITKPAKLDIYEVDKNPRKKKITEETAKYRKITEKNAPNNGSSLPVKNATGSVKRRSFSSPGLKLRVNSPRIAGNRRIQGGRKSLSSSNSSSSSRSSLPDSLAIVKSSFDPQKDFRESMVEMIVQNNIRTSKDLEELLACYLSLNSDEYHDLIIKVFKQIWFDLKEKPTK